MTVKQLETALLDGKIEESKTDKLELVVDATKVLAKTIQTDLIGCKMHHVTYEFMQSKHFKDAILDAILYTLEYKETSHPLKRSDLKLFKNKKATNIHYLETCDKLTSGIVHAIGVSDEDDDTINLMLQEILSHYMDFLELKTKTKNTD